MANETDILNRTAARLGFDPLELQPFMDAMLDICAAELDKGECIEMLTFGTLCPISDSEAFRPHSSLFPPTQETEA